MTRLCNAAIANLKIQHSHYLTERKEQFGWLAFKEISIPKSKKYYQVKNEQGSGVNCLGR
jgi:hypothetical protein